MVRPVLRVGIVIPSAQSLSKSLKSFGTEPVVLIYIPIVVLMMELDDDMNYIC